MTIERPRLAEIPTDQLSAEQSAVIAKLLGNRGRIPTPFKVWLHSPALAVQLQGLGAFLTKASSLSVREQKIAIMRLAAHWHADYVLRVQAGEAREAGISGSVIEALESGRDPHLTDAREQSVYELVCDFDRPVPSSDALFERAVRELGHAGIAEILALCGYFTAVALAMKLYRVT